MKMTKLLTTVPVSGFSQLQSLMLFLSLLYPGQIDIIDSVLPELMLNLGVSHD